MPLLSQIHVPPTPHCLPQLTNKKIALFSNRFTFPKLLVTNAESLNFDKLIDLEALCQVHKIDVIAVTEVQAQSPDLLKINNYSQFIKLRPHDDPLGKKEGGILLFLNNYLFPVK